MTSRPRSALHPRIPSRLWTYTEALAVVPYLSSILRSLREAEVEIRIWQERLFQLKERPGRPDRQLLLDLQLAENELQRAQEASEDAEQDMTRLGIFPLNAIQGTALVPFEQESELAWYIFDLFETPPLAFWRFQHDSDETRRPTTANRQS